MAQTYFPNSPSIISSINKNDDTFSNEAPVSASEPLKNIDYGMEKPMITFTMLQVLKAQKHYQQALAVLKMMELKKLTIHYSFLFQKYFDQHLLDY